MLPMAHIYLGLLKRRAQPLSPSPGTLVDMPQSPEPRRRRCPDRRPRPGIEPLWPGPYRCAVTSAPLPGSGRSPVLGPGYCRELTAAGRFRRTCFGAAARGRLSGRRISRPSAAGFPRARLARILTSPKAALTDPTGATVPPASWPRRRNCRHVRCATWRRSLLGFLAGGEAVRGHPGS